MSQVAGAKRERDDDSPHMAKCQTTYETARTRAEQALTPLTSVVVVCRLNPRVIAIPHVVQSVDSYIGPHAKWTVISASIARLPGELRLLRRLAAREDPAMDPLVKRKSFSEALRLAIRRDNFELVKWLMDEYLPRGRVRRELDGAARSGQSRTIRWLWGHHRDRVVWTSMLVVYAGEHNHLELAKWLHAEIGLRSLGAKERIKVAALWSGNVAMLEWAIELGAPICEGDIRRAAKFGHIPILEWLARVEKLPATRSFMTSAFEGGHLEVVKWLTRRLGVNATVSERDMQYSSAPIVSWAIENLQVAHKEGLAKGIDLAASRNDLELVKLLHENSNGGSCSTEAMDYAAREGHLDAVKWLHKNRHEGCTSKAMNEAASKGHVDVVKWLHEHRSEGCTTAAMDRAAENGHLEVVKWLHEHRTEGCTSDAMDAAARRGNLEMVKWLHSNRREGCTTAAMDEAAKAGLLDVVKWLHANRHEGCTMKAMDEAAGGGHLDSVRWLHEHRTEGCSAEAMANAARKGHMQVVQWLVAAEIAQVTRGVAVVAIEANQVQVVKWMLRLLPGDISVRPIVHVRSLEMAQVLHADGRFTLYRGVYRWALLTGSWQLFQWLLQEYPDSMLTPVELERVPVDGDYDVLRRHERARLAHMQDAISELEQLRGD